MKQKKQEEYFAPEFKVVTIEVEQILCGSQLPEYEEDDDHITLG